MLFSSILHEKDREIDRGRPSRPRSQRCARRRALIGHASKTKTTKKETKKGRKEEPGKGSLSQGRNFTMLLGGNPNLPAAAAAIAVVIRPSGRAVPKERTDITCLAARIVLWISRGNSSPHSKRASRNPWERITRHGIRTENSLSVSPPTLPASPTCRFSPASRGYSPPLPLIFTSTRWSSEIARETIVLYLPGDPRLANGYRPERHQKPRENHRVGNS